MVYFTTKYYSANPDGAPYIGAIGKYNPSNNNLALVRPLSNFINLEGLSPSGYMVEGSPGKLYGTTTLGGEYGYQEGGSGDGILFEYDIATNIYTKKIDFNRSTIGGSPGSIIKGDSNKLYGTLYRRSDDPVATPLQNGGSIYEYDIPSNTITILHYFNFETGDLTIGMWWR